MEREQEETQFLGFSGIAGESLNILSYRRRIFAQITLTLILPLSFVYLAHIEISDLLFTEIMRNEYILDIIPEGSTAYGRISTALSSELTAFYLFKLAYFLFFLALALLSTSAVVFTIACIYAAKEVSFASVLAVVPKVWKRLIVTFFWNFVIMFAFNAASMMILVIGLILFGDFEILGVFFSLGFVIAYLIVFVYVTIVWHLATVVSVLEESYGLNAMAKSQELIKGKMAVSFAVFFVVGVCFFTIQLAFEVFVVLSEGGFWGRIGYGFACLMVLSILMLFGLIAQTIVYLVCKSYHHENIDKSLLADHLGCYLGDYVPLKSKDVQLESVHI